MASSAGLPLAESPPVRAIPKPILMGSAARATYVGPSAPTSSATTSPATVQPRIPLRDDIIDSFLFGASHSGASHDAALPGVEAKSAPRPRSCQGAPRGARGL